MPDILIRGMEMPKDSPVYLTVCPSGGVYVHTYERGYGALVKSQYRVIELPEHGDLISADDVQHVLDNLLKRTDDDAAIDFLKWAKDCVRVLPKIVPSNKEDADGN